PGLADEVDAKAVVRLFLDASETFGLIDAARSDEVALGPQRHFPVAFLARRADALLDERAADAKPARFFLHQKQPQLCDVIAAVHQEDRAERLAACFRNPAMLARSVIGLDELRADLGDQRLVADVPAIFLGIGFCLARYHPTDVAGAMAAQQEAGRLLLLRLQRLLDRRHRAHDCRALLLVE